MSGNRVGDPLALGARRLSVGARLRQARLDAGMRLADVAAGIVSIGYLSMIEQGQRTPTPAILKQLAHRLGLDEADVQRRSDEAIELQDVCRLHAAIWADVEGNAVDAEMHFMALATAPSSVQIDARWSLSHIQLREHRDVEALDTAIDLLRDPIFESLPHWELAIQVFLAAALMKVGETGSSISNLEALISELEHRSDTSMLLTFAKLVKARAHVQAHQRPQAVALLDAIEDFTENIRTLPELRERAVSWWALRERSLADGDLVGAVRFSERAIALIQELWRADALLMMRAEAAAFRFRYDPDSGIERCRAIVESMKNAVVGNASNRVTAAMWLLSAELALADGDPTAALNHANYLDEVKPGADVSWSAMVRSRAFAMLGDKDSAIAQARRVKSQIRPAIDGMYRATQFAEPWERLAQIFRDLGCQDEAWECMRIALRGAGAVPAGPLGTPPESPKMIDHSPTLR